MITTTWGHGQQRWLMLPNGDSIALPQGFAENQNSKTPWFDARMLEQLLSQLGDRHLSDFGRLSPQLGE